MQLKATCNTMNDMIAWPQRAPYAVTWKLYDKHLSDVQRSRPDSEKIHASTSCKKQQVQLTFVWCTCMLKGSSFIHGSLNWCMNHWFNKICVPETRICHFHKNEQMWLLGWYDVNVIAEHDAVWGSAVTGFERSFQCSDLETSVVSY